jgi:hypothetical protein
MHMQSLDPRPQEQLTALKYAVRWEAGISSSDFLNYPLEGERWLVWAAGHVCQGMEFNLSGNESLIIGQGRRTTLCSLISSCRVVELKEAGQTTGSSVVPFCG